MKSIKSLALIAAIITTGAVSTNAQSLDEIVAKNIAASGGSDKLKAIQTEYTEGTLEVQGMSMPFKRWVRQGQALRMEFEVMGTTNVQVLNGDKGWSLMPVMGKTAPEDMDAATLKMTKPQMDISGPLYDWRAKGTKLELIGKDTVNKAAAYKIKLTTAEGVESVISVDAASSNVVKIVSQLEMQGQKMESVALLSDYKKTNDGYAYPGTTEQSPTGVKITITKVEHNQPVDDKLFQKP